MKGDHMGILAADPTQRELPLSNWARFRAMCPCASECPTASELRRSQPILSPMQRAGVAPPQGGFQSLGLRPRRPPLTGRHTEGGVLALFMGLSANRRQQVVVCCSLSLEKRKA